MPIEVLMRGPKGEVALGKIESGMPGTFSDYSTEPPMVISAMCSWDSSEGMVYHVPGNTQAKSKLTFIPASAYNDENLAQKLTSKDNTYEKDIMNSNGRKGRLVLRLTQK